MRLHDSNKRPEKTIFCVLYDGFNNQMAKSLKAVENLAKSNGVVVLDTLNDVANYLNSLE